MEIINDLWLGLQEFGHILPITMMFIGVIIGIVVGVLPGLSPSIGVALMLPVTFGGHSAYQDTFVSDFLNSYPNPFSLSKSTWDTIIEFWYLDYP